MLQQAAVRDFEAIPRVSLLTSLRTMLSNSQRIDMLSGQQRAWREHGPIVRQLAGPLRIVNLLGPDATAFVLMDRDHIFSARKPWTQIMGSIFPNGLLLRDGEQHKRHRRIMY